MYREVRAVLAEAEAVYRDSPRSAASLRDAAARLRQPLRIALLGQRDAGKSTLVDALVGERVAPRAGSGGGGACVWYTDGQAPRANVRTPDGRAAALPVSRHGEGPRIDLSGWDTGALDHVEVTWPARTLREVILMDVPAPEKPSGAEETARGAARDADAVIFLARSPLGTDLRSLWACQADRVAREAPLPVLLAMARADEHSGGGVDALTASRQSARQYRRDERLRGLCQHVLPISSLLADAGRGLSELEYTDLSTLAAIPRTELDAALLSADRFVTAEVPARPDAARRRDLLARFGISGIRLATTLTRQGCDSRSALSTELTRRSGLAELRESISADLVAHREVFKARSALAALDAVLRDDPRREAQALSDRLDGILAAAHEFRELRLATAIRAGTDAVPQRWRDEAERLLVGPEAPLHARLGRDDHAAPDELVADMTDALARWRERAVNPLVGAVQRASAGTLAATCERLFTDLATAG